MLGIDDLRSHCFKKKGVSEDLPFDESVLALRVGKKIFALTNLDAEEFSVNLKAPPHQIIEWREQFPNAVQPGYHMNKKHWNTVYPNRGLKRETFLHMVDQSYRSVFDTLTKKLKSEIHALD